LLFWNGFQPIEVCAFEVEGELEGPRGHGVGICVAVYAEVFGEFNEGLGVWCPVGNLSLFF
jgi:hypothetical protein